MAELVIIDASEAPKPARNSRLADRMVEYDNFVNQVPAGKVGVITPDGDESVRGVSLRVSRAGKRLGKNISVWSDSSSVYFSIEGNGNGNASAPKAKKSKAQPEAEPQPEAEAASW